MTRKKSRFLTFCCSLIPGAGEMYLGFFKQGISIMSAFALLYILGGIFLPPITVFCAVIWFYSFFHTHNLNSLPDDEFYAIQDEFLIILNNINNFLLYFAFDFLRLPGDLINMLSWILGQLPRTIMAAAIIAAGYYLIRGKKKELDQQTSLPPGLPHYEDNSAQHDDQEKGL